MPPSGSNILIVEDQAIIALDLESAVEEANGQVIGPTSTVREAMKLLHANEVDAAILDANLPDADVTPVAEALIDRKVPFVINGGRGSPPASTLPWSTGLSKAHSLVPIDPRLASRRTAARAFLPWDVPALSTGFCRYRSTRNQPIRACVGSGSHRACGRPDRGADRASCRPHR
jgi:hypothetical protein